MSMEQSPSRMQQRPPGNSQLGRPGGDSLADLLERVLDKGVVVAGDIVVNLLDIELLTLKVRLLICSADTAQQMGIDWWKHDPFLTGSAAKPQERKELDSGEPRQREREQLDPDETRQLRERIEQLEASIAEREQRDAR